MSERFFTLEQEELVMRIKVFRAEIAAVKLTNTDCPLLSSQLRELYLLTGMLSRSVTNLQKTLKEKDTH